MNNVKKGTKSNFAKVSQLLSSYIALKVYTKYENIQGIYRNLQNLKPIYKNKPSYYYRLANLAYKQKYWNKSLDFINTAIELAKESPIKDYSLLKANILIEQGKPSKSISILQNYLYAYPNDADAWMLLANTQRKNHMWEDSVGSFESYFKLNPIDPKSSFYLAESYRKIGDCQNAEINYQKAINNLDEKKQRKLLVTSYYWLGNMQLEKSPIHASETFEKVIKLDKELNSQKLGIGAYHEYFKQWQYAVEAYKKQLLQNKNDAELYFKLATILDKKLYLPEQALVYYEKALELDKVLSPWNFALANCFEQLNDYENAAKWYKNAIARQEKHRPGNYRRLGIVLNKLGKTEDALVAFKEAELFSRGTFNDAEFYKKHINKASVRYAISYEHYEVNTQMIFYESLVGARMMDNPYAIFENIFNNEDFKDYTHVWVINSFERIPDKYRAADNIIFIKRQCDAYYKYISSAKYLVGNSTFDVHFVRKPNQLNLQTGHGVFYKTTGRDSANTSAGIVGSPRNLLQATHMIAPNEFMVKKQQSSYSIRDIHSGKLAKIGYPRIDVTLNMTEESKHHISSRMGIQNSKKIVLYVPTWRGETQKHNRFDSDQLIKDLNKLAELDVNVVFRGHTMSNRLLKNVSFPKNIIIPPVDILTNELLGLADIVISDYSSVFFDFLVTNRPIIHYLYDVEEYTKERGLNLSENELPGTVVKTAEELKQAVANKLIKDKPNPHYLEVKKRFCPYEDGKSAERTVKWFFYNESSDIEILSRSEKPKVLHLVGSLTKQNKFTELINEYKDIKEYDDVNTLLFNSQVTQSKEKRSIVSVLSSNINFLVHDKNMPTTLKEAFSIKYFQSNHKFLNKDMEKTYNHAYKREARRLFGDSKFDKVVNYETDSYYYKALKNNL